MKKNIDEFLYNLAAQEVCPNTMNPETQYEFKEIYRLIVFSKKVINEYINEYFKESDVEIK